MLASSIPPAHRGPRAARTLPRDRRGAQRLPLSAAVDLTSRDNFFAGRALDISLGGLFIETSAALDVGTRIGVRIQIVDRAFAVTTEVVWVLSDRVGRPLGVGVRFLQMPAPLVDAISAFMQRRRPIGFDIEES
ncbi:MAG: PilZ domain-containing protein [Byssovorax sp.]